MRELQILIFDAVGAQLGELDLTDSDDFALKLTKSIASINDLNRRNTSFSLDFEAPQTKNNNKLLAGLRFVSATKEILGKKACSILVDGNQVDRGFLYPYESKVDGMYTLVFKGLNNDWVEQLSDVELNELEWEDYQGGKSIDATELFSSARISTVNALNSNGADVIYPYVNRNNTGAAASFRPQLHLRSIILRMFEKIGYTVASVWLDSDWVEGLKGAALNYPDNFGNLYDHLGLSVDPAFQMTKEQFDIIGNSIEYKANALSVNTDPNTWATSEVIGNLSLPTTPNVRNFYRFPSSLTNLITDNNNRFDPVTSEFTVGVGGTYSVEFNFKFTNALFLNYNNNWTVFNFSGATSGSFPPSFRWYVVRNNISDTSIDSPSNIIWQGSALSIQASGGQADIQFLQQYHVFATGDKISIFLELEDTANGFFANELNSPNSLPHWKVKMENNSNLKIVPIGDIKLGDVYRINSHIPDGIKCINLLQDFKTMFNLYFDADPNRKTVFIEPRDDFYTGAVEDITEKIDLNTAPVLNYLTSYKNEIVFQYNTDSKDKYLEQWNKINDKTYAEYKYLLQNNERFEKGQTTFKTNLISATIQGELEGLTTGIMSSVIKEEYLDADNVGKPVNKNYAMRVFQLVKGQQYDTAGVARRTVSPFNVLTAIMEDYGNTPTMNDNKLTFIGTNGLVQNYYAKTLANIEDTAIITLKINLSLNDFISWDLRKTYFINEPAELRGYYITDKIPNFNVTKEGLTTIVLVKFKDFTPATVQGGVGNVNVITQNNPQPQAILCEVNGVIVDCLDNNFQQMFKL
jgi:hypothetical protein